MRELCPGAKPENIVDSQLGDPLFGNSCEELPGGTYYKTETCKYFLAGTCKLGTSIQAVAAALRRASKRPLPYKTLKGHIRP